MKQDYIGKKKPTIEDHRMCEELKISTNGVIRMIRVSDPFKEIHYETKQ